MPKAVMDAEEMAISLNTAQKKGTLTRGIIGIEEVAETTETVEVVGIEDSKEGTQEETGNADLSVETVIIVLDLVLKIFNVIGHIARDCPDPPKKRDGSRERGGGYRGRDDRGGRGGRGNYQGDG